MKSLKRVLIIPMLVISSQLFAAPFCGLPYESRPTLFLKDDLKAIGKLNRMDGATNFIRKYKVKNDETFSYIEKVRHRNQIIDTEVVSWNVDVAIRKWRGLFRKTEASALYIERYQKLSEFLEEVGEKVLKRDDLVAKKFSKEVIDEVMLAQEKIGLQKYNKKLKSSINKHASTLGNNFYEYRYVKGHLEGLESAHCNPECLAQLERLKKELGVASESERQYFKNLVGNKKELKLKYVESIFQSNIKAYSSAQSVELVHEVASFLGSYAREVDLFWKVMKGLSEKTWVQERGIAKFFKAIYDQRATITNDPLINQIVRVHSDPGSSLSRMRTQANSTRGDSMLVDFSRREDGLAQKTWNEMKEHAKTNDAEFYGRMTRADEIADKLGNVATHLPRGIYYVVGAAATGVGLSLYISFDTAPKDDPNPLPPGTLPGMDDLPLYPDEDDEEEKVILSSRDYEDLLKVFEENNKELDEAFGK